LRLDFHMRFLFLMLLLLGCLGCSFAQSKDKWPKPEIIVAPVYPQLAKGLRIETTVVVNVFFDLHGQVTRANAMNGPCSYSSPASEAGAQPCDYVKEAAKHVALAEKYFKESFGGDPSGSTTLRDRVKEADTEWWLAAQMQIWAAAEEAARRWHFQDTHPLSKTGYNIVNLTFRFSVGREASIQVIDPWTIAVTAASYPGIQE
jgi:hypothetical protein